MLRKFQFGPFCKTPSAICARADPEVIAAESIWYQADELAFILYRYVCYLLWCY